jgi:nuclear pore complex protein Nup133
MYLVRQHGAIYSDSGYALTLTHTHAIVWPYAVNAPSPETFTFELPNASRHESDPLPLGSLVAASASSTEPGLVIITPNGGKVTYWESIASAATLDLIRQQRNGVQFSISGMHSGERVVQILNGESVGFILAFSSGRIAYMSVRDGQGRPGISVQFLRGGNGPVNGGIFGGIRNALSSTAWRGDIAVVRAGRAEKPGERNIVVATAKGKLQSWTIHRGGHSSLQAEAEERESIVRAMKQEQPALGGIPVDSFELLDFTYTPESVADTQFMNQKNSSAHLVLLASLSDHQITHYSFVEVVLNQDEFRIGTVRPINSYKTPFSRAVTSKARLYLPNPALVAYAVFDRAVVVVSMARQPDSPDSQLRTESHLQQTFEDVVDFRGDVNVEIVGSGMEEPHGASNGPEDSKSRRHKAKHPAVVLILQGGGIVRVAATDITKLVSSKAQKVTAKSKLEQAVFFGTLDKNPLSFAVRPELQFAPDEVGAAALELSQEILQSKTSYLAAMPASIEINLRKRSAALQHLAGHLKTTGVALNRTTRWKLLWEAERIAAASAIWRRYDASIKDKPDGQKRGILTDIVESIHENYKSKPQVEAGELDRVRHWFTNDIWNLEIAIPWAYQRIKYAFQDGQNEHNYILSVIYEANDLVTIALEEAFNFRTANLGLYGLEGEEIEHGILRANYEGLPDFWTSMVYLMENVRKQAELVGVLTKHYLRNDEKVEIDLDLLERIRHQNPALVDLAIRTSTERIRWSLAQDSPQMQLEAEETTASQAVAQDGQITFLATDLDLADEAIALAEQHQIMPTLASVIVMEISVCADKIRDPGLSDEEFKIWGSRTFDLQENIRRYFLKFGTTWADALYEHEIEIGAMTHLLDNYAEQQAFLTNFLRSKPEYSKLAWINEVMHEKNVGEASRILLDLGLKRERDVWSKKIELSLGAMARLAAQKPSQPNGIIIPDDGQTELSAARNELDLVSIQDQVYDHILPFIKDAIDENAEVQLALEACANRSLKKQKRSAALLEEGIGQLVRHEVMDVLTLVDLLTLMGDNGEWEDEIPFSAIQFYLALKAARCGLLEKDEQTLVQRVIWRRCMLRDDWAQVNNTDMKDDEQVSEQLRKTALYLALRACFQNGKLLIPSPLVKSLTAIGMFEENSPIKPMGPQDVLGACTDDLDHRFNGLDVSMREELMKDMQVEADRLKPSIQKCRLEKWYQGALVLAKQDYTAAVDDQTDDGKRMASAAERLREIEKGIAESVRSKAETELHRPSPVKAKSRVESASSRLRSSTRRQAVR